MTTTRADLQRTPARTCVGCRRTADPAAMVRCTLVPSGDDGGGGSVSTDRAAPGRGAWVCSERCYRRAVDKRSFARAWKRPVDDELLVAAIPALQIAFEAVITNMEDLPAAGGRPGRPVPTKG